MSQSLYQQAIVQYQHNQLDDAIQTLQALLKNSPNDADSHHLLGVLYYQTAQTDLAIASIEQALQYAPKNADYLNNLGLVLKSSGQHEAALKAYQQAILIKPKDLDIQLNIANLMMETSRFEEAAGYYRRLLRVYKPYQTEHGAIRDALCHALSQLGNIASQQGNHLQAQACFAEAVQFNPQESAYVYNLGNAERELGKAKQAAVNFKAAIARKPKHADAWNNLGNVQRELGEIDEAIKSYQHALSIKPDLHHAHVHLVHQKQHACDWQDLDEAIQTVHALVDNTPRAQVSPFAYLAMPGTSRKAQLKCANQWIKNRFQHLTAHQLNASQQSPRNKITIGYLSADFRLHPLAFLVSDLFECHDRNSFNIIAYAFGANDQSTARKRLEKSVDAFYDIRTLSEIDAAAKIQDDGVDILVDLTGFTQTSRSGIMALRPATLHVSWLGFAGTMGYLDSVQKQPLFDYLLTDETITPATHQQDYAEKFAYLPCYQPNDRQRPIGKIPSREACQLPEDAFVFCSFNQSFKIGQDVFAAWLRILKAAPNSVLWLLDCNPLAKTNLLATAADYGIDTCRIIFAPRVAIEDHLARHAHADLFLDTLIYNAHTTCSDALWMDIPVLTVQGETFSSRVASSLLKAVGLDNLVVNTLTAYEKMAIKLATDATQLAALKDTLKSNKAASVLFDTPKFTKALEATFKSMLDAA